MTDKLKPLTASKPGLPLPAKLFVVLVVAVGIGITVQIVSGRRHLDRLEESLRQVNKSSIELNNERKLKTNDWVKNNWISHIERNRDPLWATLTVGTAFDSLDAETKSAICDTCYRFAFNLPSHIELFPVDVPVLDPTGKQIALIDLHEHGTRWKQ